MEPGKKRYRLFWVFVVVLILIAVFSLLLFSNRRSNPRATIRSFQTDSFRLVDLLMPAIQSSDQIIRYRSFTLSYNEEHEQAKWAAYVLTSVQTNSTSFKRTDAFKPDPFIKTFSANDKDYEGSGFDRGHLVPAEDMSWSRAALKETFYYSNVSPQTPEFNRGVWRRLENLVRFWSTQYDSILIVTGPILSKGLRTIGPNGVSVPDYYYKVVLQYNSNGTKAIGFILKNEASAQTLKKFAIPVDSVERMSGLDFFPRLPDDIETKIEATSNTGDWKWSRKE